MHAEYLYCCGILHLQNGKYFCFVEKYLQTQGERNAQHLSHTLYNMMHVRKIKKRLVKIEYVSILKFIEEYTV